MTVRALPGYSTQVHSAILWCRGREPEAARTAALVAVPGALDQARLVTG